jgi:two-component system response regulator NreC
MNSVRILVADDHQLVREGLIKVLREAHPEWEIVGEAADGQRAIELGEALRPDVAILDLSMPESNGLEVTTRLASSVSGIRILVLTVHTAEPVKRQLRRAGASAFLAKNEAPSQLIAAVERMLAGEPFFSSESASRAPGDLPEHERVPVQYLLTPREIEILKLLAKGLSNKQVATALDMSVRTVESHRANILSRLGVESLGDMIRLAIADGLV